MPISCCRHPKVTKLGCALLDLDFSRCDRVLFPLHDKNGKLVPAVKIRVNPCKSVARFLPRYLCYKRDAEGAYI